MRRLCTVNRASISFRDHHNAAITDIYIEFATRQQSYAAVALILQRLHGSKAVEIESFLDRIAEITDEEISVEDIIEWARNESHMDVSPRVSINTDSEQHRAVQ